MVKQGPCCHCGISTTPLWRNGPVDKPVLCNACGSRWRTKGTLVNYMPMHLGGCGVRDETSDKLRGNKKFPRSKEQQSHKWKEHCKFYVNIDSGIQRPKLSFSKGLDDDLCIGSTRSEASSSESYGQGMTHAGKGSSVFGSLWRYPIPSRKRTSLCRHQLSSTKLAKLQSFFNGKRHFSSSSFENKHKNVLMPVEIGLKDVFIRPSVSVQEQESVSSSLLCKNKGHDYRTFSKRDHGKAKNLPIQFRQAVNRSLLVQGKKMKLEARKTFLGQKHMTLLSYCSPLVLLELQDIINFDVFMMVFTRQEQSQLVELLSLPDISSDEESLKDMFSSSQFKSALLNFQLLLSKGMFYPSESTVSDDALQLYVQLLDVTDLTLSGWMAQWSKLVECQKHIYSCDIGGKEFSIQDVEMETLKEISIASTLQMTTTSKNTIKKRLPRGLIDHIISGESGHSNYGSYNFSIRSPVFPSSGISKSFMSSKNTRKASSSKDSVSNIKSSITADKTYCSMSNKDDSQHHNFMNVVMNAASDSDLLLDIPSSMFFQQAELLPQSVQSRPKPVELHHNWHTNLAEILSVSNTWQVEKNPA